MNPSATRVGTDAAIRVLAAFLETGARPAEITWQVL